MTETAVLIKDSVSITGERLRSFECRYPKAIHNEVMTHRVFSRNASSSRAIPISRMIKDVLDEPWIPEKWPKNMRGMQAKEHLAPAESDRALAAWLRGRDRAVETANELSYIFPEIDGDPFVSVHKEVANRVLEPWAHINTLISSTDFANWEWLRDDEDAQPEIQRLAQKMKVAQDCSNPRLLKEGEWHLPYINDYDAEYQGAYEFWKQGRVTRDEPQPFHIRDLLLVRSTARSARVSYKTFETGKVSTWEEDQALYDRFVGAIKKHASPFEHQGTPDVWLDVHTEGKLGHWRRKRYHGNFRGWVQHRKMIDGECAREIPFK